VTGTSDIQENVDEAEDIDNDQDRASQKKAEKCRGGRKAYGMGEECIADEK